MSIRPTYVDNLNPAFPLRAYQKEALQRLCYYLEHYSERVRPTQLLFHMTTGSGKTLIMAAAILYLYGQGYRNFIFFVNRPISDEAHHLNALTKQKLSAAETEGISTWEAPSTASSRRTRTISCWNSPPPPNTTPTSTNSASPPTVMDHGSKGQNTLTLITA